MSISKISGNVVDIHLWAEANDVEPQALQQLKNIAALPTIFHHVAVMPDVHYGKGATVGSVIAMKNAVCPSAVGVDIGCGMAAIRTSIKKQYLPDNLYGLRSEIEKSIPTGFNKHKEIIPHMHNFGNNSEISYFDDLFRNAPENLSRDLLETAMLQCGTLGGGNHFIELCSDEFDYIWLMLHSGSRHIGNVLAERHINVAKKLEHNKNLPDMDLSFFLAETKEMEAYRRDLYWAQEYALLNRMVMLDIFKAIMQKNFPEISFSTNIQCRHNYVAEEIHYGENVFITRKGAIRAKRDDYGIIPGSMGTNSYIVRGLGCAESFESASHGAGRRMSRNAARKTFTTEDLKSQTSLVECRKDESILDEIPGAYKNINEVMENQKDLVEIMYTLKPLLCVKG